MKRKEKTDNQLKKRIKIMNGVVIASGVVVICTFITYLLTEDSDWILAMLTFLVLMCYSDNAQDSDKLRLKIRDLKRRR